MPSVSDLISLCLFSHLQSGDGDNTCHVGLWGDEKPHKARGWCHPHVPLAPTSVDAAPVYQALRRRQSGDKPPDGWSEPRA